MPPTQKLELLAQYEDACTRYEGDAFLREQGLCSSQMTEEWRKLRDAGAPPGQDQARVRIRKGLAMTLTLIDSHTHVQPTVEAGNEFLGRMSLPNRRGADLGDLFGSMSAAGIERTMIVPWFPAQDMVDASVVAGLDRDEAKDGVIARWRELNKWAAQSAREHPDKLSAVVGVDPILMDEQIVVEEVTQRISEGAIGIKIAPMSVRATPDDERMEIVWKLAARHQVFVLSESGSHAIAEPWGHPAHFEEVLRSYPTVTTQLAHLGVNGEPDLLRLAGVYDNFYADTAMMLSPALKAGWNLDSTVELIRTLGAHRVLFATNFPSIDQSEYAQAFRSLPFNEDELQAMGYGNAAALYGL